MEENQQREFFAKKFPYNRKNPYLWILSHVLRYPFLPFWVLVGVILSMGLQGMIPILVGNVFQKVYSGVATSHDIGVAGLQILILGLLAGLVQLSTNVAIEFLAQRMERDAREELYAELLAKSMTFHDKQKVGDIMARVTNDVRQLNLMINPGFALVYRALIGIIFPLVLIYTIDPQLLAVPVIYVIIFLFLLKRYNDSLSVVAMELRKQVGVINSRLNETLTGIHVVRAFTQENQEKEIFHKNVKKYRDLFVKQADIVARYFPLLVLGIAVAIGFLHALILFKNGQISFGDLVSYLGLLSMLRFPTFINVFALSVITIGVASAKRILAIINAHVDIDQNEAGIKKTIEGDVEFKNVTFGYEPEKPVLHDISFKVKAGQSVALVGMTGSGKTTLTKLISRLYDVQKGQVLIDGIDVRKWDLESLRSQIGLVEQDVFLFSKTIRENILFGNESASEEEMIEAAKMAQAHNFIMALPKGYDTVIGERGITLSGGQRQRIAIARAILANPKILILDDASSAIDSRTEDEIQTAIRKVLKGRTTFLITHRIAQIRHADLIVLLKRGRVVAVGTHEELLRTEPLYRLIFSRFDELKLPETTISDKKERGEQ